jgi:hypothetical protein
MVRIAVTHYVVVEIFLHLFGEQIRRAEKVRLCVAPYADLLYVVL